MRDYARAIWEQPARGLFFLNASGQVPLSFVQALTTLEFRPVLLSGPPEVKVVDVAIQRTLEALAERGPRRRAAGVPRQRLRAADRGPSCALATGAGWACCAFASWSPAPSPTSCRKALSSTTSRTTSARSRSRCRARASSRSTASIPGRCWTRVTPKVGSGGRRDACLLSAGARRRSRRRRPRPAR